MELKCSYITSRTFLWFLNELRNLRVPRHSSMFCVDLKQPLLKELGHCLGNSTNNFVSIRNDIFPEYFKNKSVIWKEPVCVTQMGKNPVLSFGDKTENEH